MRTFIYIHFSPSLALKKKKKVDSILIHVECKQKLISFKNPPIKNLNNKCSFPFIATTSLQLHVIVDFCDVNI